MASRQGILLVTNDSGTAAAIASVLEAGERFVTTEVCRDLKTLVSRLEQSPAPGVIVDIDPEPGKKLAELESIITRFGDARFIVLSNRQGESLLLESMQAGARHFLSKSAIASDLAGALHRLLPNGTARIIQRGTIITVFGAGGGCGATTLAVNLANELHLLTSRPALLVDLDTAYGSLATYLGLHGPFGVVNVLSRPEGVDGQLIHSTALAYGDGLHALINSTSFRRAESAPLQWSRLGSVLQSCRDAAAYTVVDAPRVPIGTAVDLARASKHCIILFQLNVKDIRAARGMLAALTDSGIPPDNCLLIANRYRKRRAMISLQEASTALGGASFTVLSNDYQGATRAANYGQPLAESAPRSSLRRDIVSLAGRLADPHDAPVATKPRKLWSRK